MGPYVAHHPDQYRGQHLGVTHQCTDFVKTASGAPPASLWHKGEAVHGNMTIAIGTAIACGWDGNIYPSRPHGNHAAIFISEDSNGIRVIDQWLGQRPHERVIHFRGGNGSASNDGDKFYVVE